MEVYESSLVTTPPPLYLPKSVVQADGVERSQGTHPGHSCNFCKSRFLTSCSSGHVFLNVNFSPPLFFFSGRVFKRLVDFKEKRQVEYKSFQESLKYGRRNGWG